MAHNPTTSPRNTLPATKPVYCLIDGKGQHVRFIGDRKHLGFAWEDLRECVAKATGRRLTWDCATARWELEWKLNISLKEELADGFRLSPVSNGLCIEAGREEGLRNAVYWLLQEYLGVRWYWPGKSGEYIPTIGSFKIPTRRQKVVPDYRWRWIGPGGPVWEQWHMLQRETNMGVSAKMQQDFRRWCARNLLGGLRIHDGHRFMEIMNPLQYGESHPEYYALVDGKRQNVWFNGKHGNQLCTSNPEVLELVANKVSTFFEQNPDVDGYSISPNDGGGFCECERCRSLDSKNAETYNRLQDIAYQEGLDKVPENVITRRMFIFANAIAQRIKDRHPDRYLLFLVYNAYRYPPYEIQLDDRVIAQLCCQSANYWNTATWKKDQELAKELAESSTHRGIYEYYDQGMWPGAIRLYPHLIENSIRGLFRAGYRYYSPQGSYGFAVNGLNYYTMARCLWNTKSKADDILTDFCQNAFGKAAKWMEDYYRSWILRWKEVSKNSAKVTVSAQAFGGDFQTFVTLYPREFMEARQQELQQALKVAGRDRAVQQRIQFVKKGYDYTQMLTQVVEDTLALANEGIPLLNDKIKNWQPNAQAVKYLDQLQRLLWQWQDLYRFIERNKNSPVLSYFWVRYNREQRMRGYPITGIIEAIRKIEDRPVEIIIQ